MLTISLTSTEKTIHQHLLTNEIPRIAQQFGLDTSTKANIMSAIYATQTVVNLGRNLATAVK